MNPVLELKQKSVDEIKSKIEESSLLVFCNYSGTAVDKLTEMRRIITGNKAEAKVYKNTLSKRALDTFNITVPSKMLSGPTLVISTKEDPISLTKLIKKFSEDIETIKIKGGLLDRAHIQEEQVIELAKLPGKQELIAKALGGMKSPITNLVCSLSSPIRGLVYVLNSIKEKK